MTTDSLKHPMRIEIWTDIICPWCGIGQHRLDEALRQFPHADRVEVIHRSFQLDPDRPRARTEPVKEMLQEAKGFSREQVEQMTRHVERIAEGDGLTPYVVGDNETGNTSWAHEFAAWATTHGKGDEAWALLFRAYFGEARSIFTVDALVELAGELGLNRTECRELLSSGRFRDQVISDQQEAAALGVRGVPFIAIDRKYAVSGAQPVSLLLDALGKAWSERAPGIEVVTDGEGEVCGVAGCD